MAEAPQSAFDEPVLPPSAERRVGLAAFLARHRFLLVFASLSSVMGISVGVAKVTTSLYAVQLGASAAQLGLIAGAQSVGVLIMSLPLGFLVERFGPGRLFVLGTLVAGGLYAAVPVVASATYLLVCTALISFFMPFRFVSLNSVFLGQLETIGESKAGWYRGTHMLGMFLIGPALAVVVLRALDFAGTYQAIAAAFLATIGLSPIVFGPYARRGRQNARRVTWSGIIEQLGLLARDRELRQVCSLEGLGQGTNAYFSFFIIVVAMDQLGLSRGQATSLVSVNGISFVTALFLLGGLVRRAGRRIYPASFLLGAASLLFLGFGRSELSLQVGAFGLGLGLGTLQIANLTRFARSGARVGRGKMAGLNALVSPAGAVAGNLAGGAVGRAFGPQAMFLVLAALFVVVSLVLAPSAAAPVSSADGA